MYRSRAYPDCFPLSFDMEDNGDPDARGYAGDGPLPENMPMPGTFEHLGCFTDSKQEV